MKGIIFWNGYFYGYKETPRGLKYYKSKDARFGRKKECTEEEYFKKAKNMPML